MSCTVYRFYDSADRLLYVGITSSASARLAQHAKSKDWFTKVARADFEHHPSRAAAQAAEIDAIKSELPAYNIRHADGPGEMSAEDAGDYVRVCADTIRRWAKDGVLPHYRRSDGTFRFRQSDLDEWLRSLRQREQVAS